ncbi:MAG: TonB-dependent receptor [Pseudomonadaceae bacterium]|nr:TonB-dependent receptor [Pseudomonadaceae bacterium]
MGLKVFVVHVVVLVTLASQQATAQPAERQLDRGIDEEIIVWGRAQTQKGKAISASEGLVGYADFDTRPLERVGELVEVVPGMVATQHSGEGKANQYYLRGMNLDHGTDFSAHVEGMPINMRAHAHGQGYLDLNFLIPEVISTVQYAKGPYNADRGDFSTAGTTSFSVYDRLDRPFVEATYGSDSYRRLVSAGSMGLGEGNLLAALEVVRDDGPWQLSSDIKKNNLLVKYSGQAGDFNTRFLVSLYDNEWRSTDQVPRRLVNSNTIGRFDFIDPTLGGDSSRTSFIAGLTGESLEASIFASRYKLRLFNNFTYFAGDPVLGDQFEQVDDRWIMGGNVQYRFDVGADSTLRIGGDLRIDDISDANLYASSARVRTATVRDDSVDWLSAGAFAEVTTYWTERLRTVVGLRADYFDYEVNANLSENSGKGDDTNFVPSFALAYQLNDLVEVYANWGKGFHSNDVRGATISVDPLSGDPVDTVDVFVEQEGAELGLRFEGWQGLAVAATYFWLESDSELLFVGDGGATEPSDASKRTGVEVSAFWNINSRWTADINAAFIDSKFVGVPSDLSKIPNARDEVIGAGITYVQPQGWTATLRLRHFGEAPLTEDGAVTNGDTTIVNAGLQYDFGRWQAGLELLNVFDAEDDDIAYYFASQLPGEIGPIEDVHFHPVIPFSVRASLRWELGD